MFLPPGVRIAFKLQLAETFGRMVLHKHPVDGYDAVTVCGN